MSADFAALFDAKVQELQAYVTASRSILEHAGQKGGGLEARVRRLLSEILPEELGVTEGVIYNSDGTQSGQCDVIIYDRMHAPILYNENGTRAVLGECVFAVLEVQFRLSASEFLEKAAKVDRIKKMTRTAWRPRTDGSNLRFALVDPPLEEWPIQSYFLAAEFDGELSAIERQMQEAVDAKDFLGVTNAVCVLNAGTVAYRGPGLPTGPDAHGWISFPNDRSVASTCSTRRRDGSEQSHFTLFAGLLLEMMCSAKMYRGVDFLKYLGGATFEATKIRQGMSHRPPHSAS